MSIAILLALVWSYSVRINASRDQQTDKAKELIGFLFMISIVFIIWSDKSVYHLFWMFPVSFFIGLISLKTPFSLLWILSSLYFKIWYIGIYNKGRSYYLNKEYDKALEIFEDEIKSGKKSAELYFNLAQTYGKLGKKEKEIESYENSIKTDNTIKETYFNLANAYEDIGEIDKAILNMKNAILIDSDYSKAHYSIALLYHKINNNEGYTKHYDILNKKDEFLSRKLRDNISTLI